LQPLESAAADIIIWMEEGKFYSVEEAKRLLANYCAYQDRCHWEVEQKLIAMKMIPEAREQIILFLMEHDFLNEERYARSIARGKFKNKKWGRIKIRRELRLRNISDYNIKIGLSEIEADAYRTTLEELAHKKWASLTEPNLFKRKRKLINYLMHKGYELDKIHQVAERLASAT
jgi:regulatory protein